MQSRPRLRRDYEAIRKWRKDNRTPERLLAHYTLERQLAEQLRTAAPTERPSVYGKVYDELCRSLPDHPKISNRRDPGEPKIGRQVRHLRPYLGGNVRFVELGCGDGALSLAVAAKVREAIGIDVQDQLVDLAMAPPNYRFVRSIDGVNLPLATTSVDVVFSDQLLEHLHPDDAYLQTCEVNRVLKKGGVYFCSTPSALTGPHDISMFFDETAKGLHLKEYSYGEIWKLFKAAHFTRVVFVSNSRFGDVPIPAAMAFCMEALHRKLGPQLRARLGRTRAAQLLFGINLVATK